ncbi:MAG TPA: hypothetical protein PK680_04175 [Novosphingobium sp.]|nr:hypothetical protein [Novosphingobium sp.]HQA17564.1 hypothetical protein [Novosphingobium sp.]
MTTPAPAIKGATAAQDAARDWQAVHADPSIQFAPVKVEAVPEKPSALMEFLRSVLEPIGKALGMSWPVLQWILLGLAVLGVLYAGYRILAPMALARRQRGVIASAAEDWVPDQAQAIALLEDADALAAQGRFDEATHLLLMRSVQHIAEARPAWVRKNSTAREIAALPDLSGGARETFALIAARVERSLFALRALGADDWQAAREAYARFALERIAA